MRKIFTIITWSLLVTLMAGCSAKKGSDASEVPETDDISETHFEVTSTDLHDGVWDTVITNTEYGKNLSPALSWDPVDGAECYAVYMVDTSAGNWMHWRSGSVTDTDLKQGWANDDEYIGPYPPSGTHDYEIYVIALKKGTDSIVGDFDSANPGFFDDLKKLDEPAGNILSYGHITGTYTHGDR
ncbi:MAG: phosphatidylethanolamine-binding protein [Lachnospiraceae bacterium]|nr:phosphatidylethanolamine-binding protein [Lachnospiraceae bacterium]